MNLKSIGGYMALLGVLAIVFNFFDRVPKLLMWIYLWGDTIAWIIKIAFVVVGGALYFYGAKPEAEESEESPRKE